MQRCYECGSTYEMHYVGPEDDHHHHHAGKIELLLQRILGLDFNFVTENPYPRPKNMADFIKPEYRWN